jgi:arsenate reductase
MILIYHNQRCSKSREALEIIKNSGKEFKIREYLKDPLTEDELFKLLKKLSFSPIKLIRKNESIWKDNFKSLILKDEELISIMAKNPKLIERPVVENDQKAVLGRPISNIALIVS